MHPAMAHLRSASRATTSGSLHACLDDACYHATDGVPATLLVIGIDAVECGGDGGSAAVRQAVLGAAKASVRSTDHALPTDAGEVAVLLVGAGLVAALGVGERVLRAIREIHVPAADGEARIRASVGLASTEEGILDAGELLTRATAALGAARRAGGDRPAVWAEDTVAQARKHAC